MNPWRSSEKPSLLLGASVNKEKKGPQGVSLDDQGDDVAVAVAVAVPGVVAGVPTGTVFSTVVSMVLSTVTVRGDGGWAASS